MPRKAAALRLRLYVLAALAGHWGARSLPYPMDSESVVMPSSPMSQLRTLQMTSTNDTQLTALEEAIRELSYATDAIWVLICGTLIFFMQAGFASLEVGSVRVASVQSILLKNVLDVAVGGVFWWGTGFAIAYSLNEPEKAFFGQGLLSWPDGSVSPTSEAYSTATWFFHWAYSTTAATIVSGGVAERARIESYVIYSAIMVGGIYPLIVSWTWNPDGWLRTSFDSPYYDFAGSGIIHLTGGTGALVGALVLGPRRGRFVEGVDQTEFEPHSLPLIALGTLFLWFGWFGFNMGSTHAMHTSAQALSAGLIAVNVSLAASAGGLATFLLRYLLLRYHKYDMRAVCNGILGGLVSITAPCSNVTPGGALIVGAVAGLCYQIASWSIRLLKIDDPVDAFPIHGICGIWGVLAVPLLDFSKGMDSMSFAPNVGAGYQFGIQLLAVVVIMAFVGASSLLVFGFFRIVDFFRLDVAPTVEHCSHHSPYGGGQLDRVGGQEVAVAAAMKSNENGFSAGMSWDSRAHDFDDLSST
ncbi:hypothetical protein FOL47_010313 [Perkinsus chesapeaki]|uniref:Ammonium transporter AmtB-like domain-containing protein n=1 Tax=Perkinsus chesapeaki TaxID=330153 RepID=A0A7J6L4B7_PERCH|nr:hypothetical protein FOL47_010313 [Perkinsus chesapeaki]